MRRIIAFLLVLLIGILLGIFVCRGCMPSGARGSQAKEVDVEVDSLYSYHVAPHQKLIHLNRRANESVAWTFDQDSTVDSVTAVFSGTNGSPFASSRFEFSDSAAFSGPPVVTADTIIYIYDITVYPHGSSPVNVDPGIIID